MKMQTLRVTILGIFIMTIALTAEGQWTEDQPQSVDIGVQANDVCVVVIDEDAVNIWSADFKEGPVATLTGRVRLIRRAYQAYIVQLPFADMEGWISAARTHLEGINCPDEESPVIPILPRTQG